MKEKFEKYIPFPHVPNPNRQWPNRELTEAPVWCSVDLRDGNQSLVNPMNLQEKLEMFHALVDIGVKEIEVGFPSASDTEYEILRELIDGNHIPDDVTIQVLVQARPHLIQRTFEAISGAKNVIIHFYNSTSALQRKVVFKMDMDGIIDIAVKGAELIRRLTDEEKAKNPGVNIRYEYSPESWMGTEVENSVAVCKAVMEALGASPENKVILNLPTTVENMMPNYTADMLEVFMRDLPNRESAIISLHPHNDRGEGVATAELGLLAGADRVEATLFGNGERTGNVDLITLAMNLWTQGVDPKLDFSRINQLKEMFERVTKMKVPERQPYAGELVFTAFSGSHQDAINKGVQYMKDSGTEYWEIPYLPIDPKDVGREYEPIIRINSQSGKGGAAFVMSANYGYQLPKAMHPEFGAIVQRESDRLGTELLPSQIFELFDREYLSVPRTYQLQRHSFHEEASHGKASWLSLDGAILYHGEEIAIHGEGTGPIDAFFNALRAMDDGRHGLSQYQFVDYTEHAIGDGSDTRAVAYIHLKTPAGRDVFGVGKSHNINRASLRAILCAINRSIIAEEGDADR